MQLSIFGFLSPQILWLLRHMPTTRSKALVNNSQAVSLSAQHQTLGSTYAHKEQSNRVKSPWCPIKTHLLETFRTQTIDFEVCNQKVKNHFPGALPIAHIVGLTFSFKTVCTDQALDMKTTPDSNFFLVTIELG